MLHTWAENPETLASLWLEATGLLVQVAFFVFRFFSPLMSAQMGIEEGALLGSSAFLIHKTWSTET